MIARMGSGSSLKMGFRSAYWDDPDQAETGGLGLEAGLSHGPQASSCARRISGARRSRRRPSLWGERAPGPMRAGGALDIRDPSIFAAARYGIRRSPPRNPSSSPAMIR